MITNNNCGCNSDPCGNPCICEPLTTNDVTYVGGNDVCTGILRDSRLTTVLEQLITFTKNRLFDVVSESLVVTHPTTTCNKTAIIEIVPSTDAGNIFVLGSDNFPYVPETVTTPGEIYELTCAKLSTLFTTDVNQNNTVDATTYDFLSTGCQKISPPTGFAVSGSNRQSAFGKMEWFNSLTSANTSATAGETVLIYVDAVENLSVKTNVTYQGIGIRNIGSISLVSAVDSNNTLTNLKATGFEATGTGKINFSLFNVTIDGTTNIAGNTTVKGGTFMDTAGVENYGVNLNINGKLRQAFIMTKVSMTYNSILSHSIIEDTSLFDGYETIYLNNTSGTSDTLTQLTNCYVSSANNTGVSSITGGANEKVVISNNTIRTNTRVGLQVHTGGVLSGGGSIISHNTVTNVGPLPAIVLYNVYAVVGTDPLTNPNNYMFTYNTGFSESGAGIQSILGTMKNCFGYSINNAGILIDSQENKGSQMAIVDCTGESKNLSGLIANRDIYISGGTYISRLDTSAGNPILISNTSQNTTIAPDYYYIIGVKTIARNTSALAIKAVVPLTVKIAGNRFLNEKLNTFVPGIDVPTITLVPVSIDAYGNIS